MLDVFADRALGRQLAKLERRRSRDEVHDLRDALDRLLTAAICRAERRPEETRHG